MFFSKTVEIYENASQAAKKANLTSTSTELAYLLQPFVDRLNAIEESVDWDVAAGLDEYYFGISGGLWREAYGNGAVGSGICGGRVSAHGLLTFDAHNFRAKRHRPQKKNYKKKLKIRE
jgi:hypothetical protein